MCEPDARRHCPVPAPTGWSRVTPRVRGAAPGPVGPGGHAPSGPRPVERLPQILGGPVGGPGRAVGGAVALVAARHRGPQPAVPEGEQSGDEDERTAERRDVRPAVCVSAVAVAELSPAACAACSSRPACGASSRRGDGASTGQRQQPGDEQSSGPADREDGDERGEAHYGEGRGHARDVAALGGQRKVGADHLHGPRRPGLAGGEQRHGRAERAAQQGEGKAAAAGPGGCGGLGARMRYGSHVPTITRTPRGASPGSGQTP